MAVSQRPSPPKPWELQRGRAGLTESRGATNLLSSPSDQTRLRDSGALTSASAAVQKPSESQMSSASQSYIRERSLAGSSAQNGTSTQSTSLDIPPRTPPRPWESTYSPYGGYGSSYGRPYGWEKTPVCSFFFFFLYSFLSLFFPPHLETCNLTYSEHSCFYLHDLVLISLILLIGQKKSDYKCNWCYLD